MDNVRNSQFQERLKRISAGGPNTTGQVYVGPPEAMTDRKGRKIRSSTGPDALDKVLYPLSMIGAFMVGVFAVFLIRLARFYLLDGGLTGENADLWMIFDSVFAIGIVIILRSVFRAKGKALEVAKAIGIIATVLTMHIFVHLMPGFFSSVFSPEWTQQVIATTDRHTALTHQLSVTIPIAVEIDPTNVEAAPVN